MKTEGNNPTIRLNKRQKLGRRMKMSHYELGKDGNAYFFFITYFFQINRMGTRK